MKMNFSIAICTLVMSLVSQQSLLAQQYPYERYERNGTASITVSNERDNTASLGLSVYGFHSNLNSSILLSPGQDTTIQVSQTKLTQVFLRTSDFFYGSFKFPLRPYQNSKIICINEDEFRFEGDHSEIITYCYKKRKKEGFDMQNTTWKLKLDRSLEYQDYLEQMDSLYLKNLSELRTETASLPNWFQTFLKTELYYEFNYQKLTQPWQRRFYNEEAYYPKRELFEYIDTLKYNAPYATSIWQYEFFMLSLEARLRELKINQDTVNQEILSKDFEQEVKELLDRRPEMSIPEAEDMVSSSRFLRSLYWFEKNLSRENFEYQSAQMLHRQVKQASYPRAMRAYRMFKAQHPYIRYLKFIEPEVLKKDLLRPVSEAPVILGYDSIDQKYRWSNFDNKVVLLNFWSSSCLPCLRKIPDENALLSRMKGSDFEIVKINIDVDPSKWEKISHSRKIEAHNLFAKDRWPWLYRENYQIYGYPKYVLVDKERNIISTAPPRPGSGGLERLIRKHL